MTKRACALLQAMALQFLFVATAAADEARGWIGFDGSDGDIEFAVEVNGVPASAVLDTGADAALISASLAERAGIELDQNQRVRLVGVHGQIDVPTSGRFTLELAGQPVEVGDLPVAPSSAFDLVIGRAMFEWAVVQIDYPNERIRFLHRDAVDFESNVELRTTRRGAPMIRGRLAGKRLWMLLDTGNAGLTLLKRRFVLRHDLDAHRIDGASVTGTGVVQTGSGHLVSVPGFELGPYGFEALLAAYSASNNDGFDAQQRRTGSRLRTDRVRYDAILGYEVLRNFLVTMDLAEKELHLYVP